MNEVAEKVELEYLIENLSTKERLLQLDAYLIRGEQVECPLEHIFVEHQYLRERFVPGGTLFTTYTWKIDHPFFGSMGELLIWDENSGWVLFKCPCRGTTKAGTKRVVYAITDVVWTSVHFNPTNTQNIEELEEIWLEKYENENLSLEELKAIR